MTFNFNLAISVPGTSTGTVAKTLENALRSALGEEANGLTRKEVGELFCHNAFRAAYFREVQRVDVAAATSDDRATIDANRANITTKEASIKATEQALRAQADNDWQG